MGTLIFARQANAQAPPVRSSPPRTVKCDPYEDLTGNTGIRWACMATVPQRPKGQFRRKKAGAEAVLARKPRQNWTPDTGVPWVSLWVIASFQQSIKMPLQREIRQPYTGGHVDKIEFDEAWLRIG